MNGRINKRGDSVMTSVGDLGTVVTKGSVLHFCEELLKLGQRVHTKRVDLGTVCGLTCSFCKYLFCGTSSKPTREKYIKNVWNTK